MAAQLPGAADLSAGAASAQAPEGHGVHRVIPLAHLEQWLSLPGEPVNGRVAQTAYFRGEPVKDEIRRSADRSIRSPRYTADRLAPADRNIFAMCFWLMKDYEAQLEQTRLIGPLINTVPWQYQGNPGWAYERARTAATERLSVPGTRAP